MGKRQISFFVNNELWKRFSIKCIEGDVSKTEVLIKAIEAFLKEK